MRLTEFLSARLDEDEAVARAAVHWPDFIAALAGGPLSQFGARNDPARVLREVNARRAILAEHFCGHPVDDRARFIEGEWCCYRCTTDFPCLTLRLLAAVHADHMDYRQEWKP